MAQAERYSDEGKVEKLARKNVGKSLFLLGALAVGAMFLAPPAAAVANTLAVGSGAEAIGSKLAHGHLKQRRLRKQRKP